MTTYYQLLFKT